jgi:hypothetical protein
MQQQAPRKTIVGPTGQTPIKTTTGRTNTTPIKTVVGSTARPPIKTVVGSTKQPPIKTVVGRTAAPPLKTTAANLGTGSNGPQGLGFDRPNSSANVNTNTRSLGRGDGNPGRSVAPMPPPAQGAENPVLDHVGGPDGTSAIVSGGMGPTASRMSRQPRGSRTPRARSQFFGE